MKKIKDQIQRSFRMEMIGTGLYSALATQYGRQDPRLRERLQAFSDDERMHGRLFKKCSQENVWRIFRQGRFLDFCGKDGRPGHAPPAAEI